MFGQNPIHRIYAADSPGIAERKDSRHVTIEDKQASFDQPNSRQFKTLANKNELAPVNGVLYLVRSERFNESRRKVAAEIVRRLIHRDYNNDIGDLGVQGHGSAIVPRRLKSTQVGWVVGSLEAG